MPSIITAGAASARGFGFGAPAFSSGIAFIGGGPVATGSAPTVGLPAGINAGDLLILLVGSNSSNSVPAGYTQIGYASYGGYFYVYYKFASGSESSPTLTTTGTTTSAQILAYRGATSLDVAGSFATAYGTSGTAPSISVASPGELLLAIFFGSAGGTTWGSLPGFVTRSDYYSASFCEFWVGDMLTLSSGTKPTQTMTISGNNYVNGIQIAFK